jgi:hypothetical protein
LAKKYKNIVYAALCAELLLTKKFIETYINSENEEGNVHVRVRIHAHAYPFNVCTCFDMCGKSVCMNFLWPAFSGMLNPFKV